MKAKEKKEGEEGRFARSTTPSNTEANIYGDRGASDQPDGDTILARIIQSRVVMQPICIIMIDYLPARLVRAKDRWYICFYQTDPVDRIRRRHRDTFDLNRIDSISMRMDAARTLIRQINAKLPYGYPYETSMYTRTVSMPVNEALDYVLEIKSDLRPATIQSYRSNCKKFKQFLATRKLDSIPIGSVDESLAIAYSDHIVRSGKAAVTHNNLIDEMKGIFNLLLKRKIIFHNPWLVISKRREAPKRRKPVPAADIYTILNYLEANDKTTYLSCLLEFYCMIRPNEQRYLQRHQIDLDASVISINGEYAKNHQDQVVTIPDEFKETLINLGINRLAPSDYLLGYADSIGSRKPIGKNTTSGRYTDHISNLYASGQISSRTGNTLYSWKDTGGDHLKKSIKDAVRMKNQFRHHSLEETQKYLSQSTTADKKIRKRHNLPVKA